MATTDHADRGTRQASSLVRERLTRIDPRHRVVLVTGPAGSGKTTLLGHLADRLGVPGVHRASDDLRDPERLLSDVQRLAGAADGGRTTWTWDDAIAWSRADPTRAAYLAIDDAHLLDGSPAVDALRDLVHHGTGRLTIMLASRSAPTIDLSRIRASGELLEFGPDDLRFRTWEVERLFRGVYQQPLPPEDVAALARRTEGWAVGLQLFHLATMRRGPLARRLILDSLPAVGAVTRDYLARNVLEELPQRIRRFLMDTCVLGRLTAPLCDELRGRTGSAALLRDLVRRQVFTSSIAPNTFRYHAVLRAHLLTVLGEEVGEEEMRRRFRRAGMLLERAGFDVDAIHAFARSEDWSAVRRLVGSHSGALSESSPGWVDLLPRSIVDQDPWLLLAAARRHRNAGEVEDALGNYRAAERSAGRSAPADMARRERIGLAAWLQPLAKPPDDWSGAARRIASGQPLEPRASEALPPSHRAFAAGLQALVGGDLGEAIPRLRAIADDEAASPALVLGARLAWGAARLLAGDESASTDIEATVDEAFRVELSWLSRVGRALLAMTSRPDGRSEAVSVRLAFERRGDPLGTTLAALVDGLGALHKGEPAERALEEAAELGRRQGYAALEAWARAGRALAVVRAGRPDGRETALRAESMARATRIPGAQAYATLALAEADPTPARFDHARRVAEQCRLRLPARGETARPPDGRVRIACFGGLRIEVNGRPLDLQSVRPRARQALRFLLAHAAEPVHREVLAGAVWPDASAEQATRNVHVAVSTLRRALADVADPLIVRDGAGYALSFPDGCEVDVVRFWSLVRGGQAAASTGEWTAGLEALERAADAHDGDLFPEDGPAEWIVGERERCRAALVRLARTIAELALEHDPPAAARACERGLLLDRFRDDLWRLLIDAHQRASNPAAAANAARRYDAVLEDLGVGVERAVDASRHLTR